MDRDLPNCPRQTEQASLQKSHNQCEATGWQPLSSAQTAALDDYIDLSPQLITGFN